MCDIEDIGGEKIDHKTREIIYRKGGAVSVTGRTVLADILENKIDLLKIVAVIIVNIENLGNACNEMFIVNLIHQSNRDLEVKLITEKSHMIDLEEIKEFQIDKILC